MRVEKLKPNTRITDVLGKYIQRTLRDWFRFSSDYPLSYEDFSKWEIPLGKENILQRGEGSLLNFTQPLEQAEVQQALRLLPGSELRNAIIYSACAGMFWHTNSDDPGERLYYSFTLDKAVFKWRDPKTGVLHEDWDDHGWTARRFLVTTEQPIWHSIWTAGRRFSFGFTYPSSH